MDAFDQDLTKDRKMKVLIDDVRDYQADIVIRNYDTALKFLEMFLFDIKHLMLDNDLGDTDPKKDGYAIACWIEERAQDLGPAAWPTTIEIVTSNPSALAKMTQLFSKYYQYELGRTFSKEPL